jgi:septum formation topological specificity factor MinE
MSEYRSDYSKKLRELKNAKKIVDTIEKQVSSTFKKFIESEARKKTIGLNIELIRDYLCSSADSSSINLKKIPIGIQGRGPWDVIDFQNFLEAKNFEVVNITDENVNYVVLGSTDVAISELEEIINRCYESDSTLYLYSQELFVAWLITSQDPLTSLSETDILESLRGHECLATINKYIKTKKLTLTFRQNKKHSNIHASKVKAAAYVSSPKEISSNRNEEKIFEIQTFEWSGQLSDESPLHKLGYTVRVGALSLSERRSILKRAYETIALEKYLLNKEDKLRWGAARSGQRLYAMHSLISFLIRFQGTSKLAAKSRWLSDLEWLKDNYYDSRMKFWSKPTSSLAAKKVPPATILNPSKAWPFYHGR